MRQEADQLAPDLEPETRSNKGQADQGDFPSITIESFPIDQAPILELSLTLDPLWSQPMSFYFARYREGATWPEEFGFHEPPYTDYFEFNRPRIDCKFQWFNRIEELIFTEYSAEFEVEEVPAIFTLSFDGTKFLPGGQGPHTPQKFEIPSLQELIDKRSRFSLIAHNPETNSAQEVDLSLTDIEISVSARFSDSQPATCRLFSRHRTDEKVISSSTRFSNLESEIEREALLSLHPMSHIARGDERKARLVAAIAADEPILEEDRRFAARLCFGQALVDNLRGGELQSLQLFAKSAELMQPIVLDGYPTYEEGVLMYRACANLVDDFSLKKKYDRAADFVNSVGLVAQKLVEFRIRRKPITNASGRTPS